MSAEHRFWLRVWPSRRDVTWRAVLLLAALHGHQAKVLEGHVTGSAQLHSADPNLVVLGSFGFECVSGKCGRAVSEMNANSFEKGMIHIQAHGDPFIKGQEIAMFSSDPWYNGTNDAKASWTEVYRNRRLSCAQKRHHAIFTLPLTDMSSPLDSRGSQPDSVNFYHALRLSQRPLFVHVVAMNCLPEFQGALSLYYRVTLQNPGGWWGAQFSYNDQGMLQTHVWALLFQGALAIAAVRGVYDLHANQLSHPPLLVLAVALCGFAVAQLLNIFFYTDYASHGIGPEGALVMAEILYTLSDLVIMVLFLMIAQGWRLTDEVPSKRDQMLIGGAVLVYCVCYTIIYTVDYALRDPASEVYVLLTTGAFFLALIRCMLLALCAVFFLDTYRREPSVDKQTFFRKAVASCAVWFLQMPLICIIAWSTSKWTRHRVATAWMATINTLTLAFLLYNFQPSRAKSYFNISERRDELDGLTSERSTDGNGGAGDFRRSAPPQGERYVPMEDAQFRAGADEPRRALPDEGML